MAFHTLKWKEPSHRVHYFLWHQRKFIPIMYQFSWVPVYIHTKMCQTIDFHFTTISLWIKLKCLKIPRVKGQESIWNWWKTQPKKWSKIVKLLLISWKKTRNPRAMERRWLSFSLRLFGSRFGDIAAEGLLVKYEWCLLLLWVL